MSKVKALEFVRDWRELGDQGISAFLADKKKEMGSVSPHLEKVWQAIKELSIGGKRLRGALTYLGYLMAGGEAKHKEVVIKAGVAMEIFHLGLLIQDDFMDRDQSRRGVKTVHARHKDPHMGAVTAILAGDYCYAWTSEILSGIGSVSPSRVLQAVEVWSKYFRRVGYGQTLDMLVGERGEEKREEILQVLSIKSGEYSCVLPILLGASLAGAETKLIKKFTELGLQLGWAFQIRDDILGMFGQDEVTGKPTGSDLREGKQTLLVLKARDLLTGEERVRFEEVLGNREAGEVERRWVTEIMRREVLASVEAEAREHVEKGKEIIKSLKMPKSTSLIIEGMFDLMITRNS